MQSSGTESANVPVVCMEVDRMEGQEGAGLSVLSDTAATYEQPYKHNDAPAHPYGKFDLYAMRLPFLHNVYRPPDSAAVHPEELYKTILAYQAKNDNTAKVESQTRPQRYHGQWHVLELNIPVVFVGYQRPEGDWKGPSVLGKLKIKGGGGCGIKRSSGKVGLRPLWRKESADGRKPMELWEGAFTFSADYNPIYEMISPDDSQELTLAVWAVRGLD
ncbi:hypothetical protein BXZ70DRAFT_1011062 [Cristinia sonorae]|uniref:Uncharacterized protein n=1 Tax=Cristinia sonorae TaxID=1940300 RepID=A0A8K0UGW0_9AGAR|nr:hypothetical protein BXZ70DRAFT_1011062 [Cristinia sonorae]